MPEGSGPQFFILVVMILLSGFFSGLEVSLMSINKIKLRNMVENNVKGAKTIEKIISDTTKFLGSILVGNNLVNIAISSLTTSFAISIWGNNAKIIAIITIIVTILILIFGEITPKTLAAKNPEKISVSLAKPISFIVFIFTPMVAVLNVVTDFIIKLLGADKLDNNPIITETELKTIVDVSHEEGVIEETEREMINNVFDFGDNTAKDVMTPRTDIVSISIEDSYGYIKSIFQNEQFSRMPVYRDDLDHIIGILHFKDFIFTNESNFNIENLLRPPFFSYESKLTSELFSEMRTESIAMAIILDEYGGTMGIVTIEDLVEEIVGDIFDEYDEYNKDIITIKEYEEYFVDGAVKIEDFNDLSGTKLTSDEFDSIGGFVIESLGAIPETGTIVIYDNVKLIVEEMDKNRIEKIRIIINPLDEKE